MLLLLNNNINVVLRLHCPPAHKSSNDVDLSLWVRGGFANSPRAVTRRSLLQQLDQVVKCESSGLLYLFLHDCCC